MSVSLVLPYKGRIPKVNLLKGPQEGPFLMSKRIFNSTIVESDAFLDMPLSAQALYYHLGMNADNDGFVQPKKIMRMVNAANDDLQILIAKRFIIIFDSGIAVIKHWWINNTKRVDRYAPTTHQKELAQLHIRPNNSYSLLVQQMALNTEVGKNPARTRQEFLPHINTTQHSSISTQHNTTQLNSGAISDKPNSRLERVPTKTVNEILDYWESVVGMELGNELSQRRAIATLIRQHGIEKLKKLVDGTVLAMEDRYAPRISDFVSLKRKQNDLIVWGRKRGNNNNVEVIS